MPSSPTNSVIEHLHRAALRDGAGFGDGELLGCFIDRRDEAALAALVKRHGPMVWGVCRRLLSHHDAEDAFQATFLVLVRKAASVVPREMVGNWLYGVAHQTALQARRTAARRRARETQVTAMPEIVAAQPDHWPDVQPLLDQELSRLPDNYRAVLVLCDLEGRTRKEVARQLGSPEGTVAGRLARARALLAKRLTERGVTLLGGALAAVLSPNVAAAGLPNLVVDATIQAASLFAAGKAAATGAISANAATLAEGVLKSMLVTKLRAFIAVVLILGLVATGSTILTYRTAAGQNDRNPTAEKPVGPAANQAKEKEKDKEPFTAWGKEVGGLQAGLGFLPGQKRAYHTAEAVRLVVRVRNVGKEAVKFQYLRQFFIENPAVVTYPQGELVRLPRINAGGLAHVPEQVNLAPGKEIALYELKLALRPESDASATTPSTFPGWLSALYGTGKFQVHYERVFGNSSAGQIKLDPTLSKLATGKLELGVQDAEGSPEKKKGKDGLTAWGKAIGGLQAGLGFLPGQKRAYQFGETVTLVVRVRNVGKETVKFSYLQPFIEHAPTVTDRDGKPVPQPDVLKELGARLPGIVELPPGKEIELHELKRQLRPASESGSKKFLQPYTLYGTGQVGIQYEQVLGLPSMGAPRWKLDPTLSKLATGKLELEIESDPPAKTETETAQKKDRDDPNPKPIKIRVYIEKVNEETSTITASCMLIGSIDNVTKPLRLENLRVSEKAKITDRGKEVRLTDLQLLPRDTHFSLLLRAYGGELGFEVVGIETIRR